MHTTREQIELVIACFAAALLTTVPVTAFGFGAAGAVVGIFGYRHVVTGHRRVVAARVMAEAQLGFEV